MTRRAIDRRTLLAGLAGAAGLAAVPAAAATERPHIMMLLWRGETAVETGFRAALAEAGSDARITVLDLDRDLGRLPQGLATIRAARPDLVYTWGTSITLGTVGRWDAVDPDRHLTDLPVVFTMVSAPWRTGVAAPPGQSRPLVTGTSHIAPLASQVNAIRAYLPMTRLGVVYTATEANSVATVAALRALGETLRFTVLAAPVPGGPDADPAAIPGLVAQLAADGAEVLYIGPDNFIGAHRDRLTEAGFAHGLPAFTATELMIRHGQALIGLVSRYPLVGRLAARKALSILAGRPAGTIPVETLQRFSYIVRMEAAHRLGLYPPLPLLDYAEVIR